MLRDEARLRIFARHLVEWAWSDRYRNALSAAGLVLGIAGVVIGLALVIGENRRYLDALRMFGFNTVYLSSERARLSRISPEALRSAFPEVEAVAVVNVGRARVDTPRTGELRDVTVLGVDSAFFRILAGLRVQGRPLEPADERLLATVCVVGEELDRTLRGARTVAVQGVAFRVVGVLLASAGEGKDAGVAAAEVSSALLIPRSLPLATGGMARIRQEVVVKLAREQDLERVKASLARFYASRAGGEVRVTTAEEIVRRYRSTRGHLSVVVMGFSLLALFLGGIAVSSNMVAVVLERLPEIAVRTSLGATQSEITVQFLAETLVVSVLGSTAGLVLGALVTGVVGGAGLAPVVFPWWLATLPPVAGVVVGLLSGALPALRASRHDPIAVLTLR
jgi:putative ABC transport system permease protein